MIPTGDGGKPICYGDDSYIKDDVYNPIVWIDKEPYRPRVETLVIKGNNRVFLRLYDKKKNGNWYTLPGGSIDADSSKIEQARNETNEEALIEIEDIYYTGIQYYGRYEPGYRRNHPESEFEYVGTINDVYIARYAGKFDKSKVEPKDLDPDIAENGKFYYITDILPKLSYEHKRALLTCEFLSVHVKSEIQLSISESQVIESMNPSFDNVPPPGDFIYHGSKYEIAVFHPMSIDFGNAKQEPGWSTFCFDNFTMALRFAIMRIFQSKVSGKGLEKCEWSFKHDKPYLYRCMWNKLVPLVLGETCYVYQISTKGLDIGVGNDIRFPEYTFREDHVIPKRTIEIVLDKAVIATHVEDMDLITAGAYEEEISKYDIFKKRHYACFINHDYSNDPAIKQIVDDIAKKKLQPGDDIIKYMQENDLIPENLKWNRYMKSLYGNRDNIMESYNGHLCFYTLVPKDSFGDNLITLGYMYDRKLYGLFDEATDKYRERICYDWKYYDKKPEELTREEIIDALKRFRKVDNLYQLYCFRYPPSVDLGPHVASILQDKVIYKIDIDDPKVDTFIDHIYWGRDGSKPNGKLLNRGYYERVTKEEYFSKYKDSDKMNFASLNHVAITLRGGYIPFSLLTMVDTPMLESFVDIDEIPRLNDEKYYGIPDNEPDDKRGEYNEFVVNQFKHIDTEYLGATDWEDSISKYIKKKNYDLGLYYVYGSRCGYPVYLGEILVNSDGSWCWYDKTDLMEANVNMEKPEDFLYETFNEIKDWDYGYVHKGRVITDTDDDDFILLYKTLSHDDMSKYHVGTCFDYTNYIYTEMVARYINSDDVDITCYYIEAKDDKGNNRFCHAFPIVKIKSTGFYYIIEAAWKRFAGVYKNRDKNKLIKFYHDNFLNEYKATSCRMFTEYVPKKELEGISCFVFMNTICEHGTMIKV